MQNFLPGYCRFHRVGVILWSFYSREHMIGVLAQRLLRVICPKCKESYKPPIEAIKRLGINLDDGPVEFYRGRGCEYCKGTGYKGRIGVYELMGMNDEIRELILQHSSSFQIRQAAMIVVLIIGILLAIAIPNFVNARDTSRTKACISNLKQIDGAKQQWAMANNKTSADTPDAAALGTYIKGTMPFVLVGNSG